MQWPDHAESTMSARRTRRRTSLQCVLRLEAVSKLAIIADPDPWQPDQRFSPAHLPDPIPTSPMLLPFAVAVASLLLPGARPGERTPPPRATATAPQQVAQQPERQARRPGSCAAPRARGVDGNPPHPCGGRC